MQLRKMALGAMAAVGMMSVPAAAPAQLDRGIIETVAAMFLADKLGIDPGLLMTLVGGSNTSLGGGSLFDLAPVFLMQQQAPDVNLSTLFNLRNQGLSWDQIATRTNVPRERYVQLRDSGRLDNNNLWRDIAMNDMRMPHEAIRSLRNMGFTWRDVVMTAVISRESNRSLSEVANRFRASGDWNRVASAFGVSRQRLTNRIASWRNTREVPKTWRSNTTAWVPPGLAKKGGIPPGQRKKKGKG